MSDPVVSPLPRELWRRPGVRAAVLLLAGLVVVDGLALWGILSATRTAWRLAADEVRLETDALARSLEANLATLRGDFSFLSQSPPMVRSLGQIDSDDPMTSRWARLDVEAAFLLFLDSHPEVERLLLRDETGEVPVATGRVDGAARLLRPADARIEPLAPQSIRASWPVGDGRSGGSIDATVRLPELLRIAAPAHAGALSLRDPQRAEAPKEPAAARARVDAPWWSPPTRLELLRTNEGGSLAAPMADLARKSRLAALLNLAILLLTLAIAFGIVRQLRREAALESMMGAEIRRRELERQIFHNDRLSSLGRLAAGVAHEINNPLEGMGTWLAMLEEDLEKSGDETMRESAAGVREGLDRVAVIVRQTLAFADPARFEPTTVDLARVVAKTIDFAGRNRSFRGVEIAFEAPEGPALVPGNPVTLSQVALNLLLNARESQPDGGRIDVVLREEGDRLLLEVADRGSGLAPEAVEHLFEPFFSTRGSTGMGLAVCHGIVAAHAGSIRGRNRPGGGAVFEVSLPRDRREAHPTSAEGLAGGRDAERSAAG